MFDFDWKNITDWDTTQQLNEYSVRMINYIITVNYASYLAERLFQEMHNDEE
jgi:hypothetical protein